MCDPHYDFDQKAISVDMPWKESLKDDLQPDTNHSTVEP